jgi:hypothetical protein
MPIDGGTSVSLTKEYWAGYRKGLEDAAKIAEGTDWEGMGPGWRVGDRIAAAIRSRMQGDAK